MHFSAVSYYNSLATDASAGDPTSTSRLLTIARYDERAVRVVCAHKLIPSLVASLECLTTAEPDKTRITEFLRKAVFYDREAGDFLAGSFQRLCMALSNAESIHLKASAAELIINVARVEAYRGFLFNFSESYRHLIIPREPFQERAVCGCLAYIFCDDYLGDAVAKLQSKSDVLNYVNNLFLRTVDFGAWRYSVRCLYIAGNFNEDKKDIDSTRDLIYFVNRIAPQFVLYYSLTYLYARYRHMGGWIAPQHTPGFVVRRRAAFGAFFTALLGVYSGTFHEWRLDKARERFNESRNREMRKRKGFAHANREYLQKAQFDSIDGATQSIFWRQARMWMFTGVWLLASQYPLRVWKLPPWAKNVGVYWPSFKILFPTPLGIPAPYKRVVPFVLVPFAAVKALEWALLPTASPHDYFVRWRWQRQQ